MTYCYFDTECYPNFFLFMARDTHCHITYRFNDQWFSKDGFKAIHAHEGNTLVSFNGINYDLPVLAAAMNGMTNREIYEVNSLIIDKGLKYWDIYREHSLKPPVFDHIDLMQVCPQTAPLKVLGGRMHMDTIANLPIEPGTEIGEDDVKRLIEYCWQDLKITKQLHETLMPEIEMRETLGKVIEIDLRSKSEAQVGETVLVAQTEKRMRARLEKPNVRQVYKPKRFTRLDYMNYRNEPYQRIADLFEATEFPVHRQSAHCELPKHLTDEDLKTQVDGLELQFGLGGMHSCEKSRAVYSERGWTLKEFDVTSYYPMLAINQGLYPSQAGPEFTQAYASLVRQRVRAKKEKRKEVADALKIAVNGVFGKLANKFSKLLDPRLLMQICVSGQLTLLTMIDRIQHEMKEAQIVSVNTDGFLVKYPSEMEQTIQAFKAGWEHSTQQTLEETEYLMLASRDVNNYIGFQEDGKLKTKGYFADRNALTRTMLTKNPVNEASLIAVYRMITDGIPIEDTIEQLDDIRQFVQLRKVSGGCTEEGNELGEVVRWYYTNDLGAKLTYSGSGNLVATSESARSIQTFPDELPDDLDKDFYIDQSMKMLKELGLG